ncbi:putative phosphoesterase [Prosthecobacter debontii]|uniref:Putative phosphoesterase n=2 Tax=Prosthecobacter debontii TaxID=48467 RepID=A0A1T4YX24_9BACT|nr:putative phosphoesterase [Prosthecobacter debontii]
MALADVHYGYEVHRSRQGALLPKWGMQQCGETLFSLIDDYQPQRLILVGDIMDGSFSAAETGLFLDQLRERVPELILVEGNHDRPALRRGWSLIRSHCEEGFFFTHGHEGIAPPSMDIEPRFSPSSLIAITGHEHPAISLTDGAGLRLKLPALIQQQCSQHREHWILPAFSPWAAGGRFQPSSTVLATWACTAKRVWKIV